MSIFLEKLLINKMTLDKIYIKSVIKRLFKSKIFENYASMTFMQGANVIIGLLLYPYLIRHLEKEAYGSYMLAVSVISFFIIFISFGFNLPALKQISLNQKNLEKRQEIISFVFTAKAILFAFSLIILGLLIIFIPFLRANYILYLIVFIIVISEIIFPAWYFQGMQKMKVVTIIQFSIKILSIPFIFIFVKKPDDLLILAIIYSAVNIICSIILFFYLKIKENIIPRFVKIDKLKNLFKDSLPLFWTNLMITLKLEGTTLVIATFIGVADVAIYDLARKIISFLQILTQSVNTALFPKAVSATKELVKKIITYETLFGITAIILLSLFGYPLILLLGGSGMMAAYPLMLILSVTLITWMIVNCYISFVFVPKGHYNYVFGNQVSAVISFFVLVTIGLLISKSIFSVVIALALSSFFELFYCQILIKKEKML